MTAENRLISVILSVYNGEAFLDEAVASIRGQTYRNIEIIVVDDGSTDGTAAILRRHAGDDPRLAVVSQENTGLTVALNSGFRHARGDYVARIDADDVAVPNRFEMQASYLDAHPDVLAVGGAMRIVDAVRNLLYETEPPCEPDAVREALLAENCISHPTVMIRREAFEHAGGYREVFRRAQDYDLWLRLSEQGDIANLSDPLVEYRLHEGTVSSRDLEHQVLCATAAKEAARIRRQGKPDPLDGKTEITEKTLRDMGLTQRDINAPLFVAFYWNARVAFDTGEFEKAADLEDRACRVAGRLKALGVRGEFRFKRHMIMYRSCREEARPIAALGHLILAALTGMAHFLRSAVKRSLGSRQ